MPLVSRLRRAPNASRSKLSPATVGGSRKSAGRVDESETGSANFYGPTRAVDGEQTSSFLDLLQLDITRVTVHWLDNAPSDPTMQATQTR